MTEPTLSGIFTDDATGKRFYLSLTEEPTGPVRNSYVGVDCPVSETAAIIDRFPDLDYMRDFGVTVGGVSGADLAVAGTRVAAAEAEGVLLHYSHKVADTAKVRAWMDERVHDCMFTYYHEPMGNLDPATYRTNAFAEVSVIRAHAKSDMVLRTMPILTRYWMDRPGNDPNDWWVNEFDAFGFDAYIGEGGGDSQWPLDAQRIYPTPEWMFQKGADFARTKGVPWFVPELGGARRPRDENGSARADWILEMGAWLKEQADFGGFGWWQRGGTAVASGSPEEAALNAVLTGLN